MASAVEHSRLAGRPPATTGGAAEEAAPPTWWRTHGPALAGYIFLTAVAFWPVVAHFRTRILADAGDGASYLWNLWAIPDSLFGGRNPFDTADIFFPVGAHTAFNTNMPLVSVLSWPLQKLFGLGVAANIAQLSAVVLSGFAAYRLAEHVTRNRPAAFVAGAAFTLAPYRFLHAAHYDLAHLEFLPFGILALLRLYEAPTRRRAMVLGAVVGLTFLTTLYYFLFLLIACGVVAVWRWRESLTREMAVRLLQAGGVAAAVAAPLLVFMVRELVVFHSLDPVRDWAGSDNYSANLWSWFTPSNVQRIWGDRFTHVNDAWTGGERTAFPGFTILALAVAGAVWAGRRRRGLWLALAVVFVLLSLGPFLHVGHRHGARFVRYSMPYSVPLPYWLLNLVPIFNGVRVPGRFSVVAILTLDVLAAVALARLMPLRWRPERRWLVPGVALVLVAVEFFPRGIVTLSPAVPRPYAAIAAEPGRRAVLEIPAQWRTGFGDFGDVKADHTIFLYYATRHRKPLVSGMVARYPAKDRRQLLNEPLYREVIALQDGITVPAPTFAAEDLRRVGIGYVVYHRDRPRPAVEAHITALQLPVLADDGTVLVWKVP